MRKKLTWVSVNFKSFSDHHVNLIRFSSIKVNFSNRSFLKLFIDIRAVTARLLYTSMTHRHSFTKATAHIGILDLTGKHNKSAGQLTGSDHLLQCKCSIYFDQFEIHCRKQIQTFIKKSLFIKRYEQPDKKRANHWNKVRWLRHL